MGKAPWLSRSWKIASSPYPLPVSFLYHFKQALIIGSLIAIALYVFRPFGLSNLPNEWWAVGISLLFGAVTAATVSLNWIVLPRLLPQVFREENWTVSREIGYVLWNFFAVGCCNYLVMIWLGNDIGIKAFLAMQGATLAVGAFPVGLSVILEHNKLLRKALKEAQQLQDLQSDHQERHAEDPHISETFRLEGMNQNEGLELSSIDQLLCLRADGNYVEIFALPDKIERPAILRSTLAKMEEQLLQYPSVQRCHRGYMANLDRVNHYDGNAQGLKLQFRQCPITVPVSRSYLNAVRSYLQS